MIRTLAAVVMSFAAAIPAADGVPAALAHRHSPGGSLSGPVSYPAPPGVGFVVFMPEGLPPAFTTLVSRIDGVRSAVLAATATLHITETRDSLGRIVDRPRPGYVIPVEGVGIDAAGYSAFVDDKTAGVLRSLRPGQVVLGESSARIRRLGPGGRISFEGGFEATVAAVVGDEAVGFREVLMVASDLVAAAGAEETRFAFVRYRGDAVQLRTGLAALLEAGVAFRVRDLNGPGDRTRSVRPQVFIKEVFGEFAYRPTSRGRFRIDPDWTRDNIVFADIPLLGPTWCHRVYAELLSAVMQRLADDGLGSLIDRSVFQGCWNPRYIAGSTRLSRHAWGVAADINFGRRGDGPGSPVNPVLLRRMEAAGITSGYGWTIPDPGHFEFFGIDPWPAGLEASLLVDGFAFGFPEFDIAGS